MILTLISKTQETPNTWAFRFQPESPVTWKAGQYLKYTLPHQNADERGIKRYFTNSAAPFEKNVMITTRITDKDGSSFKKTLFNLKTGDKIESEEPRGDFIIEDPNLEYVFIAGGIGITPFRSILLDLNFNNLPINITLLYANRDQTFVFQKELESLLLSHPNFKIHYYTSPQRLDQGDLITKVIPDLKKPIWYVSGPEPMVEGMEKKLMEMGIEDMRIKRDFFPGYEWD